MYSLYKTRYEGYESTSNPECAHFISWRQYTRMVATYSLRCELRDSKFLDWWNFLQN